MLNWNVNYNGTLKVYMNNVILFEISDCNNMLDNEIQQLILEELENLEYFNLL